MAKVSDPAIRKAQLADQLADEGAEPIELDERPPMTTPTVPVAPVAPDMAGLIQMLAAAIQQGNTGTADAIRDGLAANAAMARNPIAETYLNGGYPAKSVYSHPDGDLAHPRTILRCPMFLGIYNEHGQVAPVFEMFEDVCTERERVLLNTLQAGVFPVERNDGVTANWQVVEQRDAQGGLIRLVIAVPQVWLSKDQQAQMPGQFKFLQQLTAVQAA